MLMDDVSMKHQHTQLESILLGDSKAVRTLRANVRAAAKASTPVLLHGPAGSGKELAAWAIHAVSERPGPFVPCNMSRPADLFVRDIAWDMPRIHDLLPADIRQFSGGTIFLDEIARLPGAGQTLLAQALKGALLHANECEDGVARGLRVISATNASPKALVQSGHFQERLLRRLGETTIAVPSLAERRKDIPVLALYFLSLLPAAERPLGYTAAALRRLKSFDWPENVRELRRVVAAAAKLAPGEMLDEMTIEFARKTTGSLPPSAPSVTPVLADEPPAVAPAMDVDELFSRSYQTARQTVVRWLSPAKPPSRYPRLVPPRSRVP